METCPDYSSDFSRAIEKAKHQVEVWCGCVGSGRRWLTASTIDSYNDPNYRIELFVLEGSPAKGYVVADWGNRTLRIQCFDLSKLYRSFSYGSRPPCWQAMN